ncbi:MAG: histidine--tRNA ligase [Candidatus Babeliaceae bacterium]
MIARIKGTQDFLDLTLFNFLISTIKKHIQLYHFTEIATPILEPLELFKRSLGVETDVISKEMYLVHSGHEEENICLRPEVTASTMRAFLENGIQTTPWKVFSWGPMFRHERPQKGRYRQFHQVTFEIIGSEAIAQDAYFITMLDRLFHEKFLLNEYALLINFLGCPDDRVIFKKELHAFLEQHKTEICANCLIRKEKNILRVFDCKNEQCQKLYEKAPQLVNYLCASCTTEWKTLQDLLGQLSVSFVYAPRLVRGLDYYNKTVFEFTSPHLGAQNAFCGGGRYNLARQLGASTDYPAVGAAIGIERLLLLLAANQQLIVPQPAAIQVIIPISNEQIPLALLLADELHAREIATEVLLEQQSVKSMLRKADKMGAQHCILIGPEEQQQRVVKLKNMITSIESIVSFEELIALLKNKGI